MPASVLRLRVPAVAFAITFAAMCLVMLLVGSLAHAGVDPADAAGAASAAGAAAVASLAAAVPPELPQTAKDAGIFLAIATGLGVLLRFALIPLFKYGGIFKGLPLAVQHLIIGGLSFLAGAAESYGKGFGLVAALTAGGLAYAASQSAYGATANAIEFRSPG